VDLELDARVLDLDDLAEFGNVTEELPVRRLE
jgi:hypothetical protein